MNSVEKAVLEFQQNHVLKKGTEVTIPGQTRRRYYLKLADLLDAMHPYFTAKGILLTQTYSTPVPGTLICKTTLAGDTDSMQNEAVVFMGANMDPQKTCAAMTYSRRYGLMALLGVEADDDDDGETAAGRGRSKPENKPAARPQAQAPRGSAGPVIGAELNTIIDRALTDLSVPVPMRKAVFNRIAERYSTDKEKTAGILTDMAANGDKWIVSAACLPCEQ